MGRFFQRVLSRFLPPYTPVLTKFVMNERPVIAIVGTTGVGKTQLSIELAKVLGGEVVNADSMQVYKGLDIATNKATLSEREGIPHHLLGFVDPNREYSVTEFEKDALKAIDEIHSRSKIPIITGGTNYYVQSLLFNQQTIPSPTASPDSPDSLLDIPHPSLSNHALLPAIATALRNSNPKLREGATLKLPYDGDEMWKLLEKVDKGMAERWTWKDERKVRRSLQIFYTTGKTQSAWIDEQKAILASQSSLRYRTLVFWIHADTSALNPRLDKRVDEMIRLGLFQELSDMRKRVNAGEVVGGSQEPTVDFDTSDTESGSDHSDGNGETKINYTRGILQAIGFKEFHNYLTLKETNPSSPVLAPLLASSVEDMKRATRRYAKHQVAWIKNKLGTRCLMELERAKGDVGFYLLDATSIENWNAEVGDKATTIAKAFLISEKLPPPQSLSESAKQHLPSDPTATKNQDWIRRECPACVDKSTGKHKSYIGSMEWDVHMRTRGHWRAVAARKKLEEWERKKAEKPQAEVVRPET